MNELFEVIEKKIKEAGYPRKISGADVYDDIGARPDSRPRPSAYGKSLPEFAHAGANPVLTCFTPAACTPGKTLLRLQMWGLSAAGGSGPACGRLLLFRQPLCVTPLPAGAGSAYRGRKNVPHTLWTRACSCRRSGGTPCGPSPSPYPSPRGCPASSGHIAGRHSSTHCRPHPGSGCRTGR